MITWTLLNCGVDVTAFLGGLVPDLGGNFVQGDSEWLIAEADEYDRSFLELLPQIAVVTAMDADHLDVYRRYAEMVVAYKGFLKNIRNGGTAVLHEGVFRKLDTEILEELQTRKIDIKTYGTGETQYQISEVRREGKNIQFLLKCNDEESWPAQIRMAGVHNVMNAVAALIVADIIGIEIVTAIDALKKFSGIKRRFEIVHAEEGLVIIDDYAHHPEELAAAISAARLQYPGQTITGVFQPHLYSRTRDFYREFAEALSALDTSVLVELYPARELPIEGVSSNMIFDLITCDNKYLTTKKELIPLLESLHPKVLLLLGAGDLDRMIPEIIEKLQKT